MNDSSKKFTKYRQELQDILSNEGIDLIFAGKAFMRAGFIEEHALDGILQKMQITASEQANNFLRAVSAQLGQAEDPTKMFKQFCAILKSDEVLGSGVAKKLEKKCEELKGKKKPEKEALNSTSVEILDTLSSPSCDLFALGEMLVRDKFIAKDRMKTIISGLLSSRGEQANKMLNAVEAQVMHDPSMFKKLLEVLKEEHLEPLHATAKRMEG